MRDRNKYDHGKYGVNGSYGNALKDGKHGFAFFEALADRALVSRFVRAAFVICFHRDVKGGENDDEKNQHRKDTG